MDTGSYGLPYVNRPRVAPIRDLLYDSNPFYGQVVYSPGVVTDQPLSVTRYSYTDRPIATTSVKT